MVDYYVDRCIVNPLDNSLGILNYVKQHSQYQPTPFAITSDPVRVCLCTDDLMPDCTTHEAIRGGALNLMTTTAVDQSQNLLKSTIRARYTEPDASLGEGEAKKFIDAKCSKLSFHVFTSDVATTYLSTSDRRILRTISIFYCHCSHYGAELFNRT